MAWGPSRLRRPRVSPRPAKRRRDASGATLVSLRLVTDTDPAPAAPPTGRAADAASPPDRAADPTPPRQPRPTGPVKYKGEDLEAERGPGLGCFRFQLVVLAVLIVLTPLSVVWKWPDVVSALFLFAVIGLLLLTSQTIIFLLRLVAADRRGRRRPLASDTKTVGELEDEAAGEPPQDMPPP